MREYITSGLMWQGVETSTLGARRHSLTLRADGAPRVSVNRTVVPRRAAAHRNRYADEKIRPDLKYGCNPT